MTNTNIKLVFFDLGGVLVNAHLERFYDKMAALIGPDALARLNDGQQIQKTYQDFECGLLEAEPFFDLLKSRLESPIEFADFAQAYVEIFTLNDEVVNIVRRLQSQVRLSVISNTDILHYEYILKTYPIMRLFEKPTTSFQAHSLKPEPEIYQQALRQVRLAAEDTLFIDDRLENIESAKALGMQGIHFVDAKSLRNELIKYGLGSIEAND